MTKEKYIESNILKLMQYWTNIATEIGILVIIALSPIDYFVTPSNFKTFLLYRILAAIGIFILYLLNKKNINKNKHHFITISAAVIVSTMVALMIDKFGGHQSPYFAGIILTVAFVVGLAPLDVKMCIIASFIIYAIYLLPILGYDTISNKPFFIAANVFILSTIAAIILLRYLINKRFVSEFGLQYDIEQQKDQIEKYSHHLEDLVAERTKDLTVANKKYVALFDNSNDGVAIMNKDGIILDVNKRFCGLHGFDRDALIGTHFRILEAKENEKVVEQRMERIIKGESLIFEAEHYRKDGTKIFLEVSSRAIEIMGELYIQSLYRDITERKALQRQLLQAQKMESIGMLAGGLAHDFRNLLTVIQGYSEMIQHFENDVTTKKYAEGIDGATRKAEQMVTSLLQFAKQSTGEITTLNITDVMGNVLNLAVPILSKANIVLEKRLSESLPSIKGDANLLEQVIMNVIINAKDAMPDGGRLRIETGVIEVNENNIIHPLLSPGKHILISISDSGTGIPDDIKDRIFDPFFTTKGTKGTGLGLAMAYGTIKAHGGVIKVNSKIGEGSTFEIYLPLHAKLEALKGHHEEKRVGIVALIRDAELINRIKNILEPKGYRIFHSDNAPYCLDLISEFSDTLPTVMVELSLIDSNFMSKLKKSRPDIKIIIISHEEVPVRLIKDENVKATLKIPFNDSLILSAVQSVSCLNGTLKYDLPQDFKSL